jgi:hypothetical protein
MARYCKTKILCAALLRTSPQNTRIRSRRGRLRATRSSRFLAEIRDHFQSFETHGLFVFELYTVCVDHHSGTVRQIEEITRHVGFQMPVGPNSEEIWRRGSSDIFRSKI